MRTKHTVAVGVGFVVALFAALVAVPEEVGAQELAQVYELEAKQGAQQALESALRRHSQWRENNGDPWDWNVYQVVQGKNNGTYIIRSSGHSWEDFDSYWQGFGAEAGDHYNAVVNPVVKSTKAYIAETDTALTYARQGDYNLFDVTTYKLKPGHVDDWFDAVGQITEAAEQQNFSGYAEIIDIVAGAGDSHARIVGLNENWADFEQPDPSLLEVIQKVYGEKKASEIVDQFTNAYSGTYNMVVRSRPELSVEAAGQGGGQ